MPEASMLCASSSLRSSHHHQRDTLYNSPTILDYNDRRGTNSILIFQFEMCPFQRQVPKLAIENSLANPTSLTVDLRTSQRILDSGLK